MSKFRPEPKADVYQTVTDSIVRLLEAGVKPWEPSWAGAQTSMPLVRPLRHDGQPYNGINVLILWGAAMEEGYASPYWMTYDRAKALGGQVRKGEHGTKIVFFKRITVERDTDNEHTIGLPRAYSVFNCDQIDNLPTHYYPKVAAPVAVSAPSKARIPQAEAFFDALGLKLKHTGNKAFYVINSDRIQMPTFASFFTAESYYTTLAHETVHWTRHPSRLDRNLGRKEWGDEGYAMEELVAELGAAYIAADLGLLLHPREDHASYIAHWLSVMKKDKRAVFTAASHAEKAVKFLNGLANPAAVTAEDEDERVAA